MERKGHSDSASPTASYGIQEKQYWDRSLVVNAYIKKRKSSNEQLNFVPQETKKRIS